MEYLAGDGRDSGCRVAFVTSYSLCRSWTPLSFLDGSGWDHPQGCLQFQPYKTSDVLDLSASTAGHHPSGKVPTAPGYWEPDSLRKPGSLVYSLFSTRTHCLRNTKGPAQGHLLTTPSCLQPSPNSSFLLLPNLSTYHIPWLKKLFNLSSWRLGPLSPKTPTHGLSLPTEATQN